MADRRMIWKRVSTSRKVNRLSLKSTLLWTWAIPWFDAKGYLEAEADSIKDHILPRRKDFEEEEISLLVDEIFNSGLWIEYELDGKRVAYDPKFKDLQQIREDHESKSLFYGKVNLRQTKDRPKTDPLPTNYGENKIKVGEVRLNEIKAINDTDNGGILKSEIQKAMADLITKYPRFPEAKIMGMAFSKNKHPRAILYALQETLKDCKGFSPERYFETILNRTSGNFYESEHISRSEELKRTAPNSIQDALKGAIRGVSTKMQDLSED